MSYLVAIDPGVKKCAIAVFGEGCLTNAFYVTTKQTHVAEGANEMVNQMLERVDNFDLRIVIERPQIYAGSKAKGNPNDLLDLSFVAGTFNAVMDRASAAYLPAQWKGQVPKEIHHKRLSEYFEAHGTVDEMGVWTNINKLKKDHDLRDAVGLGLFHLDIVGKGGISK